MAAQAREHHWDFARALYLLLGIPFHAAVVYSTHFEWSVSSPEASPTLTVFADLLHRFRMPGFFIIAGYFAMMMLARKGPGPWLAGRLKRLGVPLVAASVTILPLQILVSTWSQVETGAIAPSSFEAALAFRMTHFDEPWISHLWFLYALIGCSMALAIAVKIVGIRRFDNLVAGLGAFAVKEKWLSFAALALAAAIVAACLPLVTSRGGSAADAAALYLHYAIYFAFGVALRLSLAVKDWYVGIGRGGLAVGLLLAATTLAVPLTVWSHAVFIIAGVVAALLITGALAGFAARRFNRPNNVVKSIVDASFTIYLVHHPVIFVLALAFVGIDWPPVAEFSVIVPAAAAISYLIHRGLARSPLLLFLFNGVPLPAGTEASGEAAPARR